MMAVRMPTGKALRDAITYTLAVGGLIWETVGPDAANPVLVTAFLGLLGLPLFVRTDEARQAAAPATMPAAPVPAPAAKVVP